MTTPAPSVLVRGRTLGPGRPALVVPLTAADPAGLEAEVRALPGHRIDIVEWRVDRFEPSLTEEAHREAVGAQLPRLRADLEATVPRPGLLVTVRTAAEGGSRAISGTALGDLCAAVLDAGGAELLDVEVAALGAQLPAVLERARALGVPTIASRHVLDRTPPEDEIVEALFRLQDTGADLAKLAVMPQEPRDVLTLLRATARFRDHGARVPLVTMSMGPLGAVSRLVGGRYGSVATFGTVGGASAPGQLRADDVARALDLLEP
ncbi:type I 3-dehydroquinate dehydratase [Brachybacterium sp. AOP25-B2-12]|uniref:type I 3-dehydroquinate dehydratase n=1 Tax=Brachybacterium sp. AOP25-B2-12 TaxID=3457710 RepID=UPI004033DF29